MFSRLQLRPIRSSLEEVNPIFRTLSSSFNIAAAPLPTMTALSFLVGLILPAVLSLVITIILLAVFYVIAVTLSPVFCIGCWAWAPVITWSIVVIFMLIYTIVMLVLYVIFANTCTDILQKTLFVLQVKVRL